MDGTTQLQAESCEKYYYWYALKIRAYPFQVKAEEWVDHQPNALARVFRMAEKRGSKARLIGSAAAPGATDQGSVMPS